MFIGILYSSDKNIVVMEHMFNERRLKAILHFNVLREQKGISISNILLVGTAQTRAVTIKRHIIII